MAKNNKPQNDPPKKTTPQDQQQQRPDAKSDTQQQQQQKQQQQQEQQPPAESQSSSSTSPKSPESPEPPESKPDFNSLPDLTQGIPSSFENETSGATTNKSALEALQEQDTAETEGGGRGRGELPASAYISSTDRKRNRMANRLYAMAVILGVSGVAYLGRDWDEEEAKIHGDIPNGWTPGLWWKRAIARQSDVLDYYREPAFDKLLPDPDPMFERPYTLCISLEDMLVHSEWSREHGWRVAKRPGVDYFLRYLSQYYELVLFTSVPFAMGDPLVRKLDPFRFIVWPLYREATKYKDGEVVKVSDSLSQCLPLNASLSMPPSQPMSRALD